MVQLTHVRVNAPGTRECCVSAVRWYDPASGNTNVANVLTIIDFIRKGGRVYVCDGWQAVEVEEVRGDPNYIRVRPGMFKKVNLLNLPRF